MKRQIKFRAWDIDNERMFRDCFGLANYGHWIWAQFKRHSSKNLIWMQFTGLTDKNGKEIYEGDVIRVNDLLGNPRDGWKNGTYRVIFETCAFLMDEVGNDGGDYLFQEGCEFEIIGNIHENKNLLK